MYTICMNDDKSLVKTETHPIYQKECNTSVIRFLVPHIVEDNELGDFICVFKYTLPDGTKCCEMPEKQEALYNDSFLDYRLNVTSNLTVQAGNIEGYLSFLKVVTDEESGEKKSYVIHSGSVVIEVSQRTDIFAYSPDCNLQAIDQKILALQSMINDVVKYQDLIESTKADDIEVIDGEVWLTCNGEKIGDPIPYTSDETVEEVVKNVLETHTLSGGDSASVSQN